jgi:general secretion pathway protein G
MKAIEQRKQMRGQGGFTLIELLVVIAILGVLAGVVVFAVGGISNNSQESACKTERRIVETAFEAYRADNQVYPDDQADLVPGLLKEAPAAANWTIDYSPAPAASPVLNDVAGGKCAGF